MFAQSSRRASTASTAATSNLVGIGIFPIQFRPGHEPPDLDGTQTLRFHGLDWLRVGINDIALDIVESDGSTTRLDLQLRLDTTNELEYLRHGGTLPHVVRKAASAAPR